MPMPLVSEMLPSRFLRKEDLEEDATVTITGVTLEDMPGDAGEKRWVLGFNEYKKGLVLNATTIKALEKAYGGNSADWVGKEIVLFVDESVMFKGQVVGGLRLRAVKKKKGASATAPTPPPVDEVPFDDDIPI